MPLWALGFVAGCVGAAQLPLAPAVSVSCLCLLIGLAGLGRRRGGLVAVCGLLAGIGLSALHGADLRASRVPEHCIGRPLWLSGTVASIPAVSLVRDATRRQRFELDVAAFAEPLCAGPTRVELAYYGDGELLPGQQWRLLVKLKRPWGNANPGSSNFQAWYALRGIDAVGHVLKPAQAELLERSHGRHYAHHRLRLDISRAIAQLDLSQDAIGLLQAVTVADKNQVSDELWRIFRALGIVHLLVISGLHVALVAAVGLAGGAVLQRVAPGGFPVGALRFVAALLPAGCYAALAGFSLPTQRALAMLAFFLLGHLLNRPGSGHLRLLAGAVAVLTLNPFAPVGAGFWLSFGAVAALLWFSACGGGPQGPSERRGQTLWRRLVGVHGYMTLVMLPLGAYFFGGGSLVAMFANMLMIPLVGLVVVPLALLGVLCHLLGWSLAELLWQCAAWPLERLLPVFRWLVENGGELVFAPLHGALPVLSLALLGVALLALPGAGPGRFFAGVMLLPLALPAATSQSVAPGGGVNVAFLDVGQGTAVVIHSGGRALLYDTGGGNPDGANAASRVVLPYLAAHGIRRLDTFVVSHGDNDHSAGMASVLAALPPRRLRYGGAVPKRENGLPCRAGEAWRWPGDIQFQFLSPVQTVGASSNNASCVLLVDLAGWRLLLAGDVEAVQERVLVAYWREQLRASALLVPHHGSGTSSTHVLLKTAAPQLALFSAGYANAFGHPHAAVVSRYEAFGSQWLNTAEEGAVEIALAGGEVKAVRRFRRGWRPYWW